MWMGFLGYNDPPSASATPSEEPPDDQGQPTGDPESSNLLIEAARRSRLQAEKIRVGRFRFGTNRFSWAMSLLIHGTVIIVAYFAVRSYLRKPIAQAPPPAGAGGSRVFLSGSDSTSAIFFGQSGVAPPPDSLLARAGKADRAATPEIQWQEHATMASLRSEALQAAEPLIKIADTSWRLRPSPAAK